MDAEISFDDSRDVLITENQRNSDGHSEHMLPLREMQESLNKNHPFGIKIWKPALYKKHRSIDARTYQDLHSIPGSIQNQFLLGNILWTVFFGWWIALIYIFIALLLLCPIWGFGVFGYFCCTIGRSREVYSPTGFISVLFKDLSNMVEYVHILLNMAWYMFYPFGKFVAKRVVYQFRPEESLPFLSQNYNNQQMNLNPPLMSESDDLPSDWSDDWSTRDYSVTGTKFPKLINRIWNEGVSSTIFFLVTCIILGPIHLLSSLLCFFFILPIPSGKLIYYLLRHLLQHPLQLTAHSCDYDPTLARPVPTGDALSETSFPQSSRPKSVFFWNPETTESLSHQKPEEMILPTIMATPTMRPIPLRNAVPKNRQYQIVLCTYRAMGMEYIKYTVSGVNIIFINLLSMIAFTLFDFYVLGPYLNFSGISSKPVIFAGGILSTVPLAYFIGMAVSSITAHTGSVAIGAVINATFGSIIEIILYAFGLMQGKEELVQGAMIGSFLLGLLALPGVSMFSGGLARTEQRFNAKSATVTSTMLVVSVIGVFTPTIFQNIHGTYQYDCKDCPNPISLDEIIIEGNGRACRSCRIYQPHPTEDPIYQKSTKPLMYICTIVLLLTYAVGLFFTLGTHAKHIYPQNPKKKKKRKIVTTQQTDVPSSVVLEHHNNNTVLLRPHKQKESKGKQRQNVSTLTDIDQSSACSSDDDANVHESPGWNIFISAGVLLTCTILYTLIAEVLIDCLDIIIEEFQMSEKILGLTIFAIVPTVTEFYNAIAFAVSGNIALSLEIGSAYAIQVALVQIPVLVGFSALWSAFGPDIEISNTFPGQQLMQVARTGISFIQMENQSVGKKIPKSEFTLVFPQWEFYTIMFSVFLLTYVYLEGKANYFKGALLLFSYFVLLSAFFFEPLHQ